jgi:hypothetical protein
MTGLEWVVLIAAIVVLAIANVFMWIYVLLQVLIEFY